MKLPAVSALALLLALAGPAGSASAGEVKQVTVHPADSPGAAVENVFGIVPPAGYAALRISVTNRGAQERKVDIATTGESSGYRSTHVLEASGGTLTVKAGGTAFWERAVPVMVDSTGSGHGNTSLRVSLSADGVGTPGVSFSSSLIPGFPVSSISDALAGKTMGALNDAAAPASGSRGYGQKVFTGSFTPEHLPSDWRGYLGMELLAITADEWAGVPAGARTALKQWIALGGTLDIYHRPADRPQALLKELGTGPEGEVMAAGLGAVRLYGWDGQALGETPGTSIVNFTSSQGREHLTGRLDEALVGLQAGTMPDNGCGLPADLGARSFAAWQVGLILLIFGILVGPVNLFWLAGPGRRHRLFVTTPLIALGASVLLVGVILIQDGVGGVGVRAAMVNLSAGDSTAYVRQYQISRTGVLLRGGFTMAEPAAVTPAVLAPSRWTRFKPGSHADSEGQRFTLPEPQVYGGDWFQSRSEQAQIVETVRPGRGRFVLKPGSGPGGAPEVVSSFPAAVEQLYYQAPDGGWWRTASPLKTGSSAVLTATDAATATTWMAEQLRLFPLAARQRLMKAGHRGQFLAVSHEEAAGMIGTLSAIRWERNLVFLHGRLAPGA